MSFDIVWTKHFKWWEKPLGYYRLLKARKNYGTRIAVSNPFTKGSLFQRVEGYQESLRRLCNIHEGRRCFVIGNGPSLRKMDLSPLRNEITIGSNGIYKLFPQMGFHTTYLTMEDIAQCEDRRHEIGSIKGPIKIFALHNAYCVPPDDSTLFMNIYLRQEGEQKFSEDCSAAVYLGSTISYINLQLAFHLGCDPVYVIGADYNYGRIEKRLKPCKIVITDNILEDLAETHFDPNYHRLGSRFGVPHVDKQYRAFQKAQEVFEKYGRRIYNAGRNSKLDVFEKVDYVSLFDEKDLSARESQRIRSDLLPSDEIIVLINPGSRGERWKRLYHKALDMYTKGRYNRALNLVGKSIVSKPNTPAYYLMASIRKGLGDLDGSAQIFGQILDNGGPHPDKDIYGGAHYHLGEMNYRQRNLIEAQFHLERCLDIIPSHARAVEYLERIKTECELESLVGEGIEIPAL